MTNLTPNTMSVITPNPKKNYQFYHIYPLGMLKNSDGSYKNITSLTEFIPHLKELSINALYIGPLFKSERHGYDTIDYYQIDPRLGTNEDGITFFRSCHNEGIDIIVDCVFNHVSRGFFAFQDVCQNREYSAYKDWFMIDFNQNKGDCGFGYASWDSHDELVKLNLSNREVKDYLLQVVRYWMETYHIDGLRMDAADVMDRTFLRELNHMTKSIKPDFFIMGEMVHGDYSKMIEETGIDSVSNYECYKGLYSSLNDVNYHEIAYSFNRLFGPWGLNHNHNLYNFVDNHDVNRVASTLVNQADLYPLYIMLYTMKGYTSIYYKSEIGVKGVRSPYSDDALRPTYDVTELSGCEKQPLYNCVKRLADIRKNHEGLCYGEHKTLLVESDLIAYKRTTKESAYVIIINNSNNTRIISEKEIGGYPIKGYDLLNQEDVIQERINIYPNWGKIIELNHIAN